MSPSLPDLIKAISEKKAELDALRPIHPNLLGQLQTYYDVELTYTSNAIEGNTLTHRETAELIEHGITVGGKPLRDHLEAEDHYQAVQWMREMAHQDFPLGETVITELHRRIVLRSNPTLAGHYSQFPRRIAGSAVTFPNPFKIPDLMAEFGDWIKDISLTPEAAFEAHFRLTAIHPFGDGNGRTARLLMNLMLLRGGYVPMAVRPEDRKSYLEALETASLTQDMKPFQTLMHQRLNETLADYVKSYRDAI